MVAQVFANAFQFVPDIDSQRLQPVGLSDAGKLQKLWRIDRTRADDHLATRHRFPNLTADPVSHTSAPAALECQGLCQGIGLNLEVRTAARRIKITERSAHPATVPDGRLGHADPVLTVAVIVLRIFDTNFRGGGDQLVVNLAAFDAFIDLERAFAPAKLIVAVALVTFHILEDRQHVAIAPAAITELCPGIVVLCLSTHEDHAVDRAGATEQLAARHRNAPATGGLLGFGLVEPVRRRILDQFREPYRDTRPGMTLPACLQDQHRILAVRTQSVGQHRTSRACAYDDVIKRFC